jgi:hypothetical protein
MLAPAPGLGLEATPSIDTSPPSVPPPPPATMFGWKVVSGVAAAIVAGGVALLALANRPAAPIGSSALREGTIVTAAAPVAPGAANAILPADVDSRVAGAATGAAVQPIVPGAPVQSIVPGAPAHAAGPARPAPRHRTASAKSAGSIDSLAAERTILDGARAALIHHDAPGALRALRSHARSFPRGQLLEERESMRVQALALAYDDDGARAAGEKFRRHFPRSMFLPAVEQALEASP